MSCRQLAALCCLLVAVMPLQTGTVAVMSVDLGSEWMKMAIVKPGVPMEIVLNKESRRKTPTVVCLKDTERLFGDNALGMSVKNPKTVYRHLQSLLGKKHNNPQVALYQKWFPEHELQEEAARGTVYFKNSEETQFSPEELLAMVLNYSRSLAEDFAEQPIKDAVVTVPAFFNQAERRAVLQAAHVAGLKVLQLINDNTAVALNYGVFRRKDIDGTPKNVMFYDMGSGSTTATIVTYQTVKTKEAGTQPQLQVRGVGFDRGLGGLEMDLRLQNHLAGLFNEQKKSQKDVRQNHRAMAKLLKEAQRLKTVLSANVDFMAQVEGLMDDMDFKAKVTRSAFEELCSDLFQRVPGPVQDALAAAEMKLDEIEQVILVGGATRVPKVQEVLLKAVGKEELGKNINADEAAAMGAVYQAAALSKAFKVKPFLVRDAAVFPIQVEFSREAEEEGGVRTLKHNRRVLFSRSAPFPQRKLITFNRFSSDFSFNINYGDLGFLSQHQLRVFGSMNLTTVKLSGVGSSFEKHSGAESKGIKAHFNMDESGVLLLDRVESVFETLVEEKEEESTLTKLGNTISTLFGGGATDPASNGTESVQDEEEVPPEAGKEGGAYEGQSEGQKDDAAEEKQESERTEETSKTDGKEEEQPGASAADSAHKKVKAQKKSKISEEVTVELLLRDVAAPSAEHLSSSRKKLQDLTDRDLAKQEREKTINSLEAFIFETQDKLHQEEYQQVASQDEQEQISRRLKEASDWLDEEGSSAPTEQLRDKLSQLKSLCRDVFFRVDEHRKWPERLVALDNLLNTSSFFLRSARLIPEDDQIFSEVELNTLEKVIKETTTWKNQTVAEQEKRSPKEKPVLLSRDIEAKVSLLDRELNYLLNKAKFSRTRTKNSTRTNSTAPDSKAPPPQGAEEDKAPPPQGAEEDKAPPSQGEEEDKAPPSQGEEEDKAPPSQETETGSPEEVQPGQAPPTDDGTEGKEPDSQSEPTEEETTAGAAGGRSQQENHIEDEL